MHLQCVFPVQNPHQVCISALLTLLRVTHTPSHAEHPLWPPAWPEASLSELHRPVMSSRGHSWAPDGGPLPEVPSEAPSPHVGSLVDFIPAPFSQRQPLLEGARTLGAGRNSGRWGWDWDCHTPPVLRLSIPVCLRAVASWVCGLLCDYLCDSVVCVVYVCANGIMCASELPLSSPCGWVWM